jgi:hypothetical protein
MNSNNDLISGEGNKGLTNEEITITVIYYTLAFLIFVVSLIFINKRI